MSHNPGSAGSQDESAHDSTSQAIIEIYKAMRAHELMLNQATSTYEHATVAPLILVNGGAAVAYLTLAGALSRNGGVLVLPASWAVTAVVCWGLGLILAQLMVGFGLKEQRSWARRERMNRQRVEWTLLNNFETLRVIVAPEDVGPAKLAKEKGDAVRARGRKTTMRYMSMVAFTAGLVFAAISLA